MNTNENNEYWTEVKEVKGLWGEFYLNRAMNKTQGAHSYTGEYRKGCAFLFSRIHIPSYADKETGEEKTTEIDTLMVSQKGIFVCEVKSWSGKAGIFGEKEGQRWFQVKASGERGGNTTGNPFRQNEHHIKYLRRFLSQNYNHAINSVVLLTDASEQSEGRVNWKGDENIEGLFFNSSEVVDYCNRLPFILSGDDVRFIASKLNQLSHAGNSETGSTK